MHWLAGLETLLRQGRDVVRVCVAQALGSTPREAGTSMLVLSDRFIGTIGGGQLEFRALAAARTMLQAGDASNARIERLPLGGDLGQCCGGNVSLLFERYETRRDLSAVGHAAARLSAGESIRLRLTIHEAGLIDRIFEPSTNAAAPAAPTDIPRAEPDETPPCGAPALAHVTLFNDGPSIEFTELLVSSSTPLWLWGAGHVARALVRVLEDTAFSIRWLDERSDGFPGQVPESVNLVRDDDIVGFAGDAPPQAFHLVMTHCHDLDYRIIHRLLTNDRFAWLGLIGSETKATCFRIRLAREGVPDDRILRMVSPIGLEGLRGKAPSTIAISVAAQLIERLPLGQR
jgi:xanthine dehydrogenase accessory factor